MKPLFWKRAIAAPAAALLAVGGVALTAVVTSAPAGAATTVHDATELQAAFESAETNIVLANNIAVTAQISRSNVFTGPVTIDGGGFTLTSDGSDRIIFDDGGGTLTLTNITLTGGSKAGDGGAVYATGPVVVGNATFTANHSTSGYGGAIVSQQDVTVTGSTFGSNTAWNSGGAITAENGITVSGSTFTANTAEDNGGGVYSVNGPVSISGSTFSANQADSNIGGFGDGGGAYSNGSMTISGSTFSGNFTTGNSDFGGGGAEAIGSLSISDSTFENNSAAYVGGGAYGDAAVTIARSTFTANCAQYGGAIEQGIGESAGGPVSIANSTIHANTSSQGDSVIGIFGGDATVAYSTITDNVNDPSSDCGLPASSAKASADHQGARQGPPAAQAHAAAAGDPASFVTTGTATFFGTIVTGPIGGPNCGIDTTVSQGYNWSDDTSCGFTDATDKVGTPNDPQLNALGAWGGPTPTQLPLTPLHGGTTSPVIDAIPAAACQTGIAAGITTDQRGVTRPQLVGCDIGAVEVTQAELQVLAEVIVPRFTG